MVVSEGKTDGPAFICDMMLGKLCRWMRIAGLDVLYPRDTDDDGLCELCLRTGRTLLTRDKDLSNRKDIKALRLHHDDLDGQLGELVVAFPGIIGKERMSRCPLCNSPISTIKSSSIGDFLDDFGAPEKVLKEHHDLFLCMECKKLYWIGGHWTRIERSLRPHGLLPVLDLTYRTEK